MTPQAKAEFEAVLKDLVSKSADELVALIEESGGTAYRSFDKAVFMPDSSNSIPKKKHPSVHQTLHREGAESRVFLRWS